MADAFTLACATLELSPDDGALVMAALLRNCDPWSSAEALPADVARKVVRFVGRELAGEQTRETNGGAPPGEEAAAGSRTACLLSWVESAVQLYRRGGADLVGSSATPLARTLRSLSASPDPMVGVQAAKVLTLLEAGGRRSLGSTLGRSPAAWASPAVHKAAGAISTPYDGGGGGGATPRRHTERGSPGGATPVAVRTPGTGRSRAAPPMSAWAAWLD